MVDSYLTSSNHVTKKMNVDLTVFGPLMFNRIGRQVDGTNIVTVDQGLQRTMESVAHEEDCEAMQSQR